MAKGSLPPSLVGVHHLGSVLAQGVTELANDIDRANSGHNPHCSNPDCKVGDILLLTGDLVSTMTELGHTFKALVDILAINQPGLWPALNAEAVKLGEIIDEAGIIVKKRRAAKKKGKARG